MALRAQTMPRHARLETVVEAGDFFDTPSRFGLWLEVMYNVHAAFAEAHDAGAARLGVAPCSDHLMQALKADIADQPDIGLQQRLRIASLARGLQTGLEKAQAIGVAYVWEGSAMGARLLQRRMARHPTTATRYLDLLAVTSAQRWQAVRAALETCDASHARVIDGANRVFEALERSFLGVAHGFD